jgi:hypothetical protein
MVSTLVDTAAPAEVAPWPVLASELVKKLRAANALADVPAVVLVDRLMVNSELDAGETGAVGAVFVLEMVVAEDGAVTVPPDALVVAVPGGVAPVSDTKTSLSELGY